MENQATYFEDHFNAEDAEYTQRRVGALCGKPAPKIGRLILH